MILTMKFNIIKFLTLITVSIPMLVYALDTSEQEKQCQEIGFKKNTAAFGKCVLELMDRVGGSSSTNSSFSSNDPDDATCRKYGFKPGTTPYGQCRQQIDTAKQQAQQQQAQYLQQRRQYEEQMAEYKKKREEAKAMALLGIGLNMMSGGSATGGGGYGSMPMAPSAPSSYTNTYILPNNKMMTCNTTGTVTNCF